MKSSAWRRAAFFAAALVIAIVGAVSAYESAMSGADVAVGVLR
jgi:hypothetical protein